MASAASSPSSRRAWIEIWPGRSLPWGGGVALLAEGVDRNIYCATSCRVRFVALLAEGVDRNVLPEDAVTVPLPSPSSRRAWIEI